MLDARVAVAAAPPGLGALAFDAARGELLMAANRAEVWASPGRVLGAATPVAALAAAEPAGGAFLDALLWLGPDRGAAADGAADGAAAAALLAPWRGAVAAFDGSRGALWRLPPPTRGGGVTNSICMLFSRLRHRFSTV